MHCVQTRPQNTVARLDNNGAGSTCVRGLSGHWLGTLLYTPPRIRVRPDCHDEWHAARRKQHHALHPARRPTARAVDPSGSTVVVVEEEDEVSQRLHHPDAQHARCGAGAGSKAHRTAGGGER